MCHKRYGQAVHVAHSRSERMSSTVADREETENRTEDGAGEGDENGTWEKAWG